MQGPGESLTDEKTPYHAVISSSPAHKQPLQQVLRQVDILLSHGLPEVQTFAELAHCSHPVLVFEVGVAPIKQFARHYSPNLLEGAER